MSFLRRLFGGPTVAEPASPPLSAEELEAAERERERELLRGEAERLDELRQRQLRYAEYAWEPPAQGGERRSDDPVGAGDALAGEEDPGAGGEAEDVGTGRP